MHIEILDLLEGARNAKGLVVVIDVFRAFSTACYASDKGAGPIYPVGDIDTAYQLKEQMPNALLVGERDERMPPGFDYGNSPYHLMVGDIGGRAVVHTTSSGTQGIANALQADEIITGSFVNAGAIVRYIQHRKPSNVSLVCMGYACNYPTDEDTLCAVYIQNCLLGIHSDFDAMRSKIRSGSGARFFAPESQSWAPQEDFELCLDLNRFDFVLRAHKNPQYTLLERVDC